MGCLRCNGRGFIEAPILVSQGNYGTLLQCCNIQKYSAEVKRRIDLLNRKNGVYNDAQKTEQRGVVLQLRRKQDEN